MGKVHIAVKEIVQIFHSSPCKNVGGPMENQLCAMAQSNCKVAVV